MTDDEQRANDDAYYIQGMTDKQPEPSEACQNCGHAKYKVEGFTRWCEKCGHEFEPLDKHSSKVHLSTSNRYIPTTETDVDKTMQSLRNMVRELREQNAQLTKELGEAKGK